MVRRTVTMNGTPHLIVTECRGNLRIRGREALAIEALVQGQDEDLAWTVEGETVEVEIGANGTIQCPKGTHLVVNRVLGNLRIEGIEGRMEVGTAHGNATVREVGHVVLEHVLGNLRATEGVGDVEARDVRGNAWIRRVRGRLTLGEVAGNLEAEGVERGMVADMVRGNISLRPPFPAGRTYRLTSHGNLSVALTSEASVRLVLRADGRIDTRYPGLDLHQAAGEATGSLGAGDATIEADVRGNVSVRSWQSDEGGQRMSGLDEVGAQLEWQVHDALAKMAEQLEEKLGRVDGEWIRHRVGATTLEARRRAEQAAERARMRAERAERRWRRAAGERPAPKREGPTDEERLRVLQMVEKGKVTPEQASDLLRAIEGE